MAKDDVFRFDFYFPPEESEQYTSAAEFLHAFADHLAHADDVQIQVTGRYLKQKKKPVAEAAAEPGEPGVTHDPDPASKDAPASGEESIPIITIRACPGKRP